MRRVKADMRPAMGAERLTGLALLHTYRDWIIGTDKVVEEFYAKTHAGSIGIRILNIYIVKLKRNVGIDLHVITDILFKRLNFPSRNYFVQQH